MNHSEEDEEDFLSADEDIFDDRTPKGVSDLNDLRALGPNSETNSSESNLAWKDLRKSDLTDDNLFVQGSRSDYETGKRSNDYDTAASNPNCQVDTNPERLADNSVSRASNSVKYPADEDEEDEEVLTERIRERNLRIARKFSAEIAKNVKASAPIPVTMVSSVNTKSFKVDCPNLQDSEISSSKLSSSFQPPAPPPTPALASSFNQFDDHAQPSTPSMTSTVQTSTKTQYSWRLPPIARQTTPAGSLPDTTAGESARVAEPSTSYRRDSTFVGSDQARRVLDKLSDKLSDSSRNLFEQVAEDLKKVSLIDSDNVSTKRESKTSESPLASISELGSTLGGWGWSGATKLLSSATQVTSHVGSVIDSVVNVSGELDNKKSEQSKIDGANDATDTREDTSATVPGDPLVDFTLNAMESLGKRAFDVMTKRDETGSIQIKGLGRPWEVLNLYGDRNSSSREEPTKERSLDTEIDCSKKTRSSRNRDKKREDDAKEFVRAYDESQHEESDNMFEKPNKAKDDIPVSHPTLKNRKSRRD